MKNDYYSSTIDELFAGKDSIIELAKIISYDNERQVARVWTMSSNQYKDDVPVFFASSFRNTGIVSPPVKDSTSMLIWGPDRQPYLLPVQINTPYVEVDKGLTNLSASPSLTDVLHTLKNIQGGEHLIRSLGGAYVFLKNLGDVELGTSRLHRLALTEKDGALDLIVERIRVDTGNSRFYLGPASMDSNVDPRTHYYFELEEFADEPSKIGLENEELVNQVLTDSLEDIEIHDSDKIYTSQKGHVFDSIGEVETDPVDGTELFSKKVFEKGQIKQEERLSKGGRKVIRTSAPERETEVIISPNKIDVMQSFVGLDGIKRTTSVKVDEWGNIICTKDGKEYDLWAMLQWFYEVRT